MGKLKDSSKTTVVDTSLYVETTPYLRYIVGTNEIASDSPGAFQDYALTYMELLKLPSNTSIAIIGGGTCVLPRMLMGFNKVDVYELYQEIATDVTARFTVTWNWFIGDWNTTLTKNYDVIVYDIGDVANVTKLTNHLKANGKLINLSQ